MAATISAGRQAWAAADHAHTDVTPAEALELLKKGNADFVNDVPFQPIRDSERRLEIAKGQKPFAVLVGCSDSRVSPEILFGRGLGELFILRVAGNTVDLSGLGTIEYAVSQLGVPLIVVLGHERCGAVAAAVEVVQRRIDLPGSLGELIGPIVPAVLKAQDQEGDILNNAIRENIRRVVRRLHNASPLLEDPLAAGKLKIVGAHYDLDNGMVDFFTEA
jgi:carbonic anhydrase